MQPKDILYFETFTQPLHEEWLLLVHGAGGSTRTWKRQIDDLGAQYNLLIIDLPGHGQSKNHQIHLPQYSFENIAKKIWEVVDYLQIAQLHLVGISLGTILCLEMHRQHEDRVQSLILPGAIVKLNRKLRWLAQTSLSLAKVIGYRSFYKLSARIMMPRENHKTSREVFIKESRALTIAEFKNWTQMYYGLNKVLKHLFHLRHTTPQLLVMGSQDHLFLSPAQQFEQFHPNALLQVIPQCGHVVSIEKAKVFNSICLQFLASLEQQSKTELAYA